MSLKISIAGLASPLTISHLPSVVPATANDQMETRLYFCPPPPPKKKLNSSLRLCSGN